MIGSRARDQAFARRCNAERLYDIARPGPAVHSRLMITRKSICISLTPEYDRFDAAQLTRGRCQTASETFRTGLRLLEGQAEPWATKCRTRRKQPARFGQGG